jgi:hypothetical protein
MNAPATTAIARRELDVTMLVPTTIQGFYAFAADYHAAGLVPSGYKNTDQVAIAMIKGHEFGMLPAQSVDAFYVVNGRACPWGRALRGLVQSSGNLEGELDGFLEGTDELQYMCEEENPYKPDTLDHALAAELQRALRRRAARVKGKGAGIHYLCGYSVVKRKGQAPRAWLFDSFDATKAGLIGKNGPWSQMPGRMCQHRAATFLRSDVFSDRLTGLDMTAEEAMDVSPIDLGTQATPAERPPGAGPTATLAHLAAQPAAPAREIITVVQPDPAPPAAAKPPPASDKARAEIYAVGGPAPASDLPLESEFQPVTEEKVDAPGTPASKPNGTDALKAAVKAATDAGLDAAKVGSEAIEAMMGKGVKTKDLGDGDKLKVAAAIMGKIEALQAADAGADGAIEDEAAF